MQSPVQSIRRTLILGSLLIGLFGSILVARAVIWNVYGGSGNPVVLVHPVLEAAIDDYEECIDDAGHVDPLCVEVLAFRFPFYDTLDDEMGIRIELGPEGSGGAFADWAADGLAGVLAIDESWESGVQGRLLERQLFEVIDALKDWAPGGDGSKLVPGEIVLAEAVATVVTESWLLPRGPDESGTAVDCVDPKIHHAYMVREPDTVVDVDSFAHWPPYAATLNPIDSDPLEFVLTRNLLRDEHFCFANAGNADPFCQRLYAAVGMAGQGLPGLWAGETLTIEDPNSPYGTWIDRGYLDADLLDLIDSHVVDFEGFFYPDAGVAAVGWRDETRVTFEPFEFFDWPCVFMTLDVPLFAPGTGEPVEVTLDENGSQSLQLSIPDFEAAMTAQYLVCWAGSYTDPGSQLPSLEEGIVVTPWGGLGNQTWHVDTRGLRTHPGQGRALITGGTGTAALQADLDTALQDGDVGPVPFLAAALSVPLAELAEVWADEAGPFLGLYAKRVNNRVGEDPDTGNEAIAAIAGVTPMWDESSDCTRWEGSLAGLSVVLGDVADQTWAIGGTLSSLQGRNLASVDHPASWVRLDSESMEEMEDQNQVSRLDWLRDINATLQQGYGDPLPHPLDDTVEPYENVRVLLADIVSGLVGNAVPAYDGEFCEARWGDRNTWPSAAYDVWHSCLDAVNEDAAPNEQQLCEYYLHEVAVAFFDTCVQPQALFMGSFCAGFAAADESPAMTVSDFAMGPGHLRWDEVSADYYDTYLDGQGGCACAEMDTIINGDFQTTDSYDHYEIDPPSPYLTRQFVDTDGDRYEDTQLTYLRFPAWATLSMDLAAQMKVKLPDPFVSCQEHDTPNGGKATAYEDRLADLDAFRADLYGGELPASLQDEHDRLSEWLDDNLPVVNWYDDDIVDAWQHNVGVLDGAAHLATIDGGELEILLGVEWAFPLVEERGWEWMAQRWANNVVPVANSRAQSSPVQTTSDVTLSVDGLCLYLDPADVETTGASGWLLEDYLLNMTEAPCAAGTALLGGSLDLDSAMGLSLPIPFMDNTYWGAVLDLLEDDDDAKMGQVTDSLQAMYEQGNTGSSAEPPLIAALAVTERPLLDWPQQMLELADPLKLAVYPRMLLVDQVWHEGFHTGGDLSHGWTLDELFVSSISYGMSYDSGPPAGSLWTGPDVPVNTGHLAWYALQPQFASYTNESLTTIDSVTDGWLEHGGQPYYSVTDDRNLFAFSSEWNPHEDELRGWASMPAWCPGQPNDQAAQP